jgi:hypothetical protein
VVVSISVLSLITFVNWNIMILLNYRFPLYMSATWGVRTLSLILSSCSSRCYFEYCLIELSSEESLATHTKKFREIVQTSFAPSSRFQWLCISSMQSSNVDLNETYNTIRHDTTRHVVKVLRLRSNHTAIRK